MTKTPIIPENFDPNIAHIIDADGNIFQELAPVETMEVVVDHRVVGEDEEGRKIVEPVMATIELPREWDEAATVAQLEG